MRSILLLRCFLMAAMAAGFLTCASTDTIAQEAPPRNRAKTVTWKEGGVKLRYSSMKADDGDLNAESRKLILQSFVGTLSTSVPLAYGRTIVPAGKHSLRLERKKRAWVLVVEDPPAKKKADKSKSSGEKVKTTGEKRKIRRIRLREMEAKDATSQLITRLRHDKKLDRLAVEFQLRGLVLRTRLRTAEER